MTRSFSGIHILWFCIVWVFCVLWLVIPSDIYFYPWVQFVGTLYLWFTISTILAAPIALIIADKLDND